MNVSFRTRILWPNHPQLLPAERYGVKVPAGLASVHVRTPKFVDVAGMSKLLQSSSVGSTGKHLSTTKGLVTRELEVRFADFAKQWRFTAQDKSTAHGGGRFQFLGGDICIDLTLGIYVLNTHAPDPSDPIADQIFAEVYGHELLHVLDEIDIVLNWLPPRLKSEPTIDRYLVEAKPFTYGRASDWTFDVIQEFHRYIEETIHGAIRDGLWAEETNRREQKRDAPSEYKKLQDRIDTLRTQQINR